MPPTDKNDLNLIPQAAAVLVSTGNIETTGPFSVCHKAPSDEGFKWHGIGIASTDMFRIIVAVYG